MHVLCPKYMHALDQSTQITMSSRAHFPHVPLSSVPARIASKNEYSTGLPARIARQDCRSRIMITQGSNHAMSLQRALVGWKIMKVSVRIRLIFLIPNDRTVEDRTE